MKDKELIKMKFIYNAINDGFSVKKKVDGTYNFIRSKDVNLKTFIMNCLK